MMRTFERFMMGLHYDLWHPFKSRWSRILRRMVKWERCFVCRSRWGQRYLFIIGIDGTTHVWMCVPCLRETVAGLIPSNQELT